MTTNEERPSRMTKSNETKPLAAVRPRGKSVPRAAKPTATIPVTPNVLKNRRRPRTNNRVEPEPFVFKAKPVPIHKNHKSCGALHKITSSTVPDKPLHAPATSGVRTVTKTLNKLTLHPPQTAPAVAKQRTTTNNKENITGKNKILTAASTTTSRQSRSEVRPKGTLNPPPRVRSNSAPGQNTAAAPPHRAATIPVTPMVLKRSKSRITVLNNNDKPKKPQQAANEYNFKAKPAGVLHRKPFQPKLGPNNIHPGTGSVPIPLTTKPFDLRSDSRLEERKLFNHRTNDALEQRQKQAEEDKKRAADEQYAAARLKTHFRATRNPLK